MVKTHLNMMEDLCEVFHLHSAGTELLLNFVDTLLAEGKRKEVCSKLASTLSAGLVYIYMLQAVTYARTFHLQSHFSMDEMLLPLVGMDKMNLVEKSIYLLFS